ncbi:phage head completion protein [Enterococcus sp. BWR-S5]|uniref:phage head completion protein n=1 Tax=Enterococcus sp. BWR-S5 TaxID=2787714 RepID=UPI0019211B81|nr:head-tail adaptor protein [Enterococcus sp. BWR-S5]
MRLSRTAITISYTSREEVEAGVWENIESQKTIKAEQEQIYQRRIDQAQAEGLALTARFRIRSSFSSGIEIKYVEWKGARYKVSSVVNNIESHYMIIEIGEML